MRTRVTKEQRDLLDEICELMAGDDLRPRIISRSFAGFDATVRDPVTREISSRFKELLRDMPSSGEIRDDLRRADVTPEKWTG
jgi:hypothetical protein